MALPQVKIGVIGGSGLYQMPALTGAVAQHIPTPFGDPSDALVVGELAGVPVAFLARHGRHHQLLPTELPARANIYALKTLGVEYLISVSAVGSLRSEVKPLDLVVVDQFIDRTRNRISTFFGAGIVAHITFENPVCPALAQVLIDAINTLNLPDVTVHRQGTYVCMEGPAFSTKAESELYRSWGATVIGMTNLPEAKLAREAEIAYATLALATDYDCWHPDHASVSVEMVVANLRKNVTNAQAVIQQAVTQIAQQPPPSKAHRALKNAIMTPLDHVPPATLEKLRPILAPYLKNPS
ncbi:5'-methylthioadenosine phosphorylase [Gloeomargarita lithophora Alchichica-D10]|uniref:S-methyl-5'-thioadenosine phosphorylase n=1 Tax=Gloeomargarita lithophora Alchichica-D10 TaxID=1188229 RepID=A0A1J0A9D5_9CYAN|nr:S-methyl-5'-thioadenosine phosphorylase [Gloeomargarita lithophora]APB32533.1 5'-methylthioadenosine phosphorylase [Gloeomargarita lithophora Alchichica-D10]